MSKPRGYQGRDVYVSKATLATGVPAEPWHEEKTGVHTDAQVFRAIKGLREEMLANKTEAARAHGALKADLVSVKTQVEDGFKAIDTRFDKTERAFERMSGQLDVLVPMATRRSRSSSSETKAIATEALATQVLAEARDEKKYKRDLVLKIVGGLFSAYGIGALLKFVLERL